MTVLELLLDVPRPRLSPSEPIPPVREREETALVVETARERGWTKMGIGGSGSESESKPSPPVSSERAYTASKKSVEAGGGAERKAATVEAMEGGGWSESGAITWDRRTLSGGLERLGWDGPSESLMSVLLLDGITMLFLCEARAFGGDSDRILSNESSGSSFPLLPPNADMAFDIRDAARPSVNDGRTTVALVIRESGRSMTPARLGARMSSSSGSSAASVPVSSSP